MAFKREVYGSVQQRVARAQESGEGLALGRHKGLFKGDSLVARQDRLADPD